MSTYSIARSSAQPNPLTDESIDGSHGPKAIEVAAMLGDSVIDVKHCIDPRSGRITPKTWGLAAAGLSCVLLSAVAFATSVKTAAYNKDALDYWTRVAHKPAAAFRARQLSFGYDWLAFGGFALGMGSLAGSLVRMRRERRSPYYRIGTAPEVEQPITGAPTESFPLVAPSSTGDDFVLHFGAGMTGETMVDGKLIPLAELAASGHARASASVPGAFEMPIPLGSRIRAQVGQTSFLVSGVAKPREQAAPLFAALESRKLMYVAGSLAAHLGIVGLLAMIPVDDSTANVDLASIEDVGMRSKTTDTDVAPPEPPKPEEGGGGSEGQQANSMHLDPGKAGDKKEQSEVGHIRIAKTAEEAALARVQAIQEARTAGVLGAASALNGAMFADLQSDLLDSSGPDSTNVWGAIYGADGTSNGTFGYGRSGFGAGCDENCLGGGIIGTQGYGKIGLGKYGREGYDGPLGGGPNGRKHHASTPPVVIGQPDPNGDMDPAIIRRYIKRNVEKVSYCYERQLLAHPGIEGQIKITFFIAPNGSVQSSRGTGFNADVASCVADVVGSISFPQPKNGGGVQVNYPFTFHAATGG